MNTTPNNPALQEKVQQSDGISERIKKVLLRAILGVALGTTSASVVHATAYPRIDVLKLEDNVPGETVVSKTQRWKRNGTKMLTELEETLDRLGSEEAMIPHMLRQQLEVVIPTTVKAVPGTKDIQYEYIVQPSDIQYFLSVLPITQQILDDPTIPKDWKDFILAGAQAAYVPGARILVVRDDMDKNGKSVISPEWHMISLLHEAFHAQEDLESRPALTENEKAEEEIHVRTLEGYLMQIIGGQAYRSLVDAQKKDIADFHRKTKSDMWHAPVPPLPDERIDDVFGLPASDNEMNLRRTMISYQAYLEYFKDLYKELPEKQMHKLHIDFYKTWTNTLSEEYSRNFYAALAAYNAKTAGGRHQ